MAAKKTLVVFGATGGQGGSVVRSILEDAKTASQFAVRAVTRDTSKPAAKALTEIGAEVVAADLDDKSSLQAALKGAYAVFSVTNFWEKASADLERQQGINVADVCKEVGVEHLIWSSLLNVKKLSGGALSEVHHFDSKAGVEDHIRKIGVPASFFLAGFYMSNIPGANLRLDEQSNVYVMALPVPPTTPIPLFDHMSDTGKFVKGILLNREKTLDKRIYGATDYYTPEQILEDFKALKPKVSEGARTVELPHEAFKGILGSMGMPPPIQEELLQNMRLLNEFGYYGGDSLTESHSIVAERLTTWKEFASKSPAFVDLK